MGLFDFWKKNDLNELPSDLIINEHDLNVQNADHIDNSDEIKSEAISIALPEILEQVFIEKEPPQTNKSMNSEGQQSSENDINVLYKYLEQSLDKQGYEDAMTNPDMNNMNENLEEIQSKLFIVIAKVKRYYSGYIKTINFHIDSRSRSGMIDMVDELNSRKETASEELQTVIKIEEDAADYKGLSLGLFSSYRKGFRTGLAAISTDAVFKNKP